VLCSPHSLCVKRRPCRRCHRTDSAKTIGRQCCVIRRPCTSPCLTRWLKFLCETCAHRRWMSAFAAIDFATASADRAIGSLEIFMSITSRGGSFLTGVAERPIRTWFKMIRGCLLDQGRPKSYWKMASGGIHGRCPMLFVLLSKTENHLSKEVRGVRSR
jgi:hypothetical protein